jgi:hypothetical protein
LSQSEVFAVAFALLAAGAVILTLNVLLLVIASFPLSAHHTMSLCSIFFSMSNLLSSDVVKYVFTYKKEDLIVS